MTRTRKLILLTALVLTAGMVVYAIYPYRDYAKSVAKTAQRISEFPKKDEFAILQEGDIIFQTSQSDQSRAIQLATHSKFSHMGIIYKTAGKYFVYEAVQTVKLTPLEQWIGRGEGRHFVAKRVDPAKNILSSEALKKIRLAGSKYNGKNYDLYFEWSNSKVYCSELIWKIYKEATGIEIGTLQKLGEFDLTSQPVKTKLKERYGRKVPLNEKVISPSAMFESDKLITVVER